MPIQIGGFTDADQLKWAVLNSPDLISQLANLADALGFGWCGGTNTGVVGQGFDLAKSGDTYVAQAHYNGDDPHHDGYWADKRLKITLSNFRITIDPSTFAYGPVATTSVDDVTFATVFAKNYSSQDDDQVQQQIVYQLTDTLSHSVNVSFTEGLSVAVEASAGIPFLGQGKVTTTFSFSSTQGWEDTTETSTSLQQSLTYTGAVPAHSQRQLDLMVQRNKFDIPYTSTASIDFQIDLYGFLRWGGNARHDLPTDRPFDTVTFGSSSVGGIADFLTKVAHQNISGDWPWVDWGWVNTHYPGRIAGIAQALTGSVSAQLSGIFDDVGGTSAYIKAGDSTPLPAGVQAQAMSRAVIEAGVAVPAAAGATLVGIG